ncbi:MAG: nuclear transport factor 2 family protein, partial [Acidimicrobiales bacterium]
MTTTLRAPESPLTETMEDFFRTKTSCDVAGTMSFFSPDLATYTDATLGWDIDSFDTLRATFEQYMPNWTPPARSYFTALFSNEHSALIHMVDTPELFGGELRILAAVDFADGKIVRWVDYWDATPFDADLYAQMRTPTGGFPTDLKDDVVITRATPELVATATALHAAFTAGDAGAAAALLHTDIVLEDMTLRTRLVGKLETLGYLSRVPAEVPYGQGGRLRHAVGGRHGGGFEWTSADGLVGISAIELDAHG